MVLVWKIRSLDHHRSTGPFLNSIKNLSTYSKLWSLSILENSKNSNLNKSIIKE